jgi:Holliday junction resolvase RusA-like endonuclease
VENQGPPADTVPQSGARTLRFRIPLPPSTNALYTTVRTTSRTRTGTRRVRSPAAQAFRQSVLPLLDLLDGSGQYDGLLSTARRGYWGITLDVYFPSPHRRDLDDVLKIAIDTIAEGLRLADRRLVDLRASKFLAPLDPRVEVALTAYAEWSFRDERPVLRPPGGAPEYRPPDPPGQSRHRE